MNDNIPELMAYRAVQSCLVLLFAVVLHSLIRLPFGSLQSLVAEVEACFTCSKSLRPVKTICLMLDINAR